MARIAVTDGITVTACTPHILPGLYNNDGAGIGAAVARFQRELDEAGILLRLVTGADVHIAPDLLEGLRSGRVPALADSRYFLLEPPQAIMPPRFDDYLFSFVGAGYVPIITHPERLGWIESHYSVIPQAVRMGAWIQVTGGALLGRFGRRAKYWSERMLADGLVHILASDGHNTDKRRPCLADAFERAVEWVGREEARQLVETRPAGILKNLAPSEMPTPEPLGAPATRPSGFWGRLR